MTGEETSSTTYSGAEPQCIGLKNDGGRCTNGTTYSTTLCGMHKKIDDLDLAPDGDDREWYWCAECGWQPAQEKGSVPRCSNCGDELEPSDDGEIQQWSES